MKFYKKDEYAVTMIEHDSSADEVLTAFAADSRDSAAF